MDVEAVSRHLQGSIPGLLAIYLFGSYVSGDFHAGSDLDIAVLLSGKGDPLMLWRISGEVADIVAVPVDLVDLRAASTVMQYQIVITGQLLWAKDSAAKLFETYVLGQKTALDTARAGVLEDVQREGVIHGRRCTDK